MARRPFKWLGPNGKWDDDDEEDTSEDWKKGYSNKPVRMKDGEMFGILGICTLFVGIMFLFFATPASQGSSLDSPPPLTEVLGGVLLSAGVVFSAYAFWKAMRGT